MKKCPDCGHLNLDDALFCEECGHKFGKINENISVKIESENIKVNKDLNSEVIEKEKSFFEKKAKENKIERRKIKQKIKSEYKKKQSYRKEKLDPISIFIYIFIFIFFIIVFYNIIDSFISDYKRSKDYYNLGITSYDNHNYKKALSYFQKALNNESTRHRKDYIYTYIGLCYYKLKNYDKALFYYNKAYKLDPKAVYINYDLYLIYRYYKKDESKAYEFAKNVIDNINKLSNITRKRKKLKTYAFLFPFLIEQSIKKDKKEDVLKYYNLYYKYSNSKLKKLNQFYDIFMYLSKKKDVNTLFDLVNDKIFKLNENLAYLIYGYLSISVKEDYKSALKYFNKCKFTEKEKQDFYKYYKLYLIFSGEANFRILNYKKALKFYKLYIEKYKDNKDNLLAMAYIFSAYCYLVLADKTKAKDYIKLAENLNIKSGRVYFNLFIYYKSISDIKKALYYAKKAIKYYPNSKVLLKFLNNNK